MITEKEQNTTIIIPFSVPEKNALRKKLQDSGLKQYRFVKDLIIESLIRENYLPNPQA